MSGITDGVKNFLKGTHKENTTEVCSEVAPEVVQESVRPQEHVETAEAVDREKHVHHHQHRVQPIEDHKVLPTQHVASAAPVINREHKEEMNTEHQAKLHEQRTAYQDTTIQGETERSASHVGVSTNEHEHHHIHETIQPVIQRETIQPTTVHQVIPVHERIDVAPVVHEATTLPTISHEQFLKSKANAPETHSDAGHNHQVYEGAPKVGGHNSTTQ